MRTGQMPRAAVLALRTLAPHHNPAQARFVGAE